ncbi:hypothetical protein CAEBREN_11446 [Caenorhabditis brenneri]|uniref:Uncharacterized protein n=1 Tax=Caenorhabditis brenneri TaxID=135651 RepID=G0NNG0_CAEBE|nr:hypothetical protein CAEBREN_11446 [Caenorhabditis brenneri]
MEEPIFNRSLNIEQELLAEIKVYRDKQKRWGESKLARMIRRGAIHLIYWLSLAWFMTTLIALFLPSILPSIHPELSAINAGFLLAGVLLGLYGIATMRSEKRTIAETSLEYYQSIAEGEKKALGLLDQLEQNQETYQQKVEEELRKIFLLLSRLTTAIYGSMTSALLTYKFFGESYVAGLLYAVFFFSLISADVYCHNQACSDQKSKRKQLAVQK